MQIRPVMSAFDPKRTSARLLFVTRSHEIAVIDAPTVNLTKGNEALLAFVPKHEADGLKALKQRKSAHAAKFGIVVQHPGQPVIRNTTA